VIASAMRVVDEERIWSIRVDMAFKWCRSGEGAAFHPERGLLRSYINDTSLVPGLI